MRTFNTTRLTDKTESVEQLPMAPLLILAMTSFIATANEIVPAGLLPQIAEGFAISQAWAGQLVSACALGSGLAAIPLTIVFRKWSRKSTLMLTLLTFLICNTVTALSPYYSLTLIARLFVGLATGLAWSQLASYARLMVSDKLQGRALAVAMAGIPIALSFGVPLSAWAVKIISWHHIFGVLAAVTLGVMVCAALLMPNFSNQTKASTLALNDVLKIPGVTGILFVVMTWILAHYLLFTYIAPFLNFVGLIDYVDSVLLIFGLSAMAGLWIVGRLIDTRLRLLVLTSLILFAISVLIFGLCGSSPHIGVISLAVSVWGLSFSGAPTLLQTALAETAGNAADVAQSMLVTVFNLAFAASGVVGGILLGFSGVASLPWLVLIILLVALVTVWRANKHGFC